MSEKERIFDYDFVKLERPIQYTIEHTEHLEEGSIFFLPEETVKEIIKNGDGKRIHSRAAAKEGYFHLHFMRRIYPPTENWVPPHKQEYSCYVPPEEPEGEEPVERRYPARGSLGTLSGSAKSRFVPNTTD